MGMVYYDILLIRKIPIPCEISGSHGGEYEDDCLLGCCVVESGRSLPKFQRFLLPLS
jgi:hypothetical protein